MALHQVVGPLALERKLPEPFRTTWLSLRTAEPLLNAQGKFASSHEKQQHDQKRKEKQNKRETREHLSGNVTKLVMELEQRLMVERVLKNAEASGPERDRGNGKATPLSKNEIDALTSSLKKLGFRQDDINHAVTSS